MLVTLDWLKEREGREGERGEGRRRYLSLRLSSPGVRLLLSLTHHTANETCFIPISAASAR
jgi:hypothetical protein